MSRRPRHLTLAAVGVEIEHGDCIACVSVVAVQAYPNIAAEHGHLALAAFHCAARRGERTKPRSVPAAVYADEESDISMGRQIIEETRLQYWRRHPNVDLAWRSTSPASYAASTSAGLANVRP